MSSINAADYRDAFTKVAEYSRRFFHYYNFKCVEDLILDATNDGPTQPWVSYLLQCRFIAKNRYSIPDVRVAMTQFPQPKWFATFQNTLWTLYTSQRSLTTQMPIAENPLLRSLSKPQRRTLRGSHVVHYRRQPQLQRKEQMLDTFRTSLQGSVVQWGDNFAKFKYPVNPQSLRDMSLSGTVYARVGMSITICVPQPWPSPESLINDVTALSLEAFRLAQHLGDNVRPRYTCHFVQLCGLHHVCLGYGTAMRIA